MYLGRLFSFESTHDVELKNRGSKHWIKFSIFRTELSGEYYDIERRMKVFKAVVQPTLLYGCSCWTMTRAGEQLIRTCQRKMLRQIVGARRRVEDENLEEWLGWMIRATDEAEQAMRKFAVPDWVEEARRRKFRWAGHVIRRDDGRWTREVLTWSLQGTRSRGRPFTRWTDSLNKFFEKRYEEAEDSFWLILAEDRYTWHALDDEYIEFMKM